MSQEPKHTAWEELVRLAVLIWSAGMLTASYAGLLDKMDPTFIASLLSGTLAGYGISRMDPKGPAKPSNEKPSPPQPK